MLKVGDKIAYLVQFLQSIGVYTGEMPAGRGTIISLFKIGDSTFATISWNNLVNLPTTVNIKNLAKVGLNTRFSSC